jgi:nucleotide-binding universal stress UspA family protein
MTSPDPGPVVVGVDGAPGSAGALRFGIAEARRRGTALHLVHVLPIYPPVWPVQPVVTAGLQAVGTGILERAAAGVREAAPDLEITTALAHGPRSSAIVEAAQQAQLVVVGRETRRGVDRMLTGATTAGVAARASCSVVVVPSSWMPGPSHGRVVVGIKTHRNAHELLARACAEARARDAELTLVTAWELPDPYLDRVELRTHAAEWEADGRRVLNELLADWRTDYPDVPVEIRIAHGRAAEALLDASAGSDLLLVSRRRHAMPPYGRLGGVPHALLRLSEVPVEVVPYVDDGDPEPVADDLVLEEAGAPLK